jgi:mRNA interferase MazF
LVSAEPYVPRRGDVVWIDLNPIKGHEQSGRRPAVVISLHSYNERVGLAVFCPVTNRIKGYPFEVSIPQGLPVTGVVLSDQVKSMDWLTRNAERICALPRVVTEEILGKLRTLFE